MSVWTMTAIIAAAVFAFGLFCAIKAKLPPNVHVSADVSEVALPLLCD